MCYLCDTVDGNGESQPTSVLEYIINEFLVDSIDFTIPAFKKTFDASKQYINEFYQALAIRVSQEQAVADEAFNKAVRLIDTDGMNVAAIEKKEDELKSGIMKEKDAKINEFRKNYLEKKLCSHIDDDVRSTALSLVSEKHQLSKIYSIENFAKQ